MKKEIIIVVVIIILIITTHVLTQNYTKKSIEEMYEKLDEIESISKRIERSGEEDASELHKKIEEMQSTWGEINEKMAFYIEHNELEKVNTSLTLMKCHIEMEDYSEGLPELHNTKYILYHIQDKQSLKIINLF